jgi:ABC-type Na+ efflux pump permease subunit
MYIGSSNGFDNFNRNFKTTRRRIGFMIAIRFIISIVIVVVIIAGIVFLFNNPELIGEFFGKISNGYNSTR